MVINKEFVQEVMSKYMAEVDAIEFAKRSLTFWKAVRESEFFKGAEKATLTILAMAAVVEAEGDSGVALDAVKANLVTYLYIGYLLGRASGLKDGEVKELERMVADDQAN